MTKFQFTAKFGRGILLVYFRNKSYIRITDIVRQMILTTSNSRGLGSKPG